MERRSTQSGTTATDSGDSWTHVRDKSQRKRIQNRVAQRTYRNIGPVKSLSPLADSDLASLYTNSRIGQKFKSRIEALERWRDAAKSSTTAPLIPTNTHFPATETESGAEQKAVSIAFPTHPSTRTHDFNRDLVLLDPNTLPEQGNNALISHQGVQASTLTPTSIPDSSFLHQEPHGSSNSPYDPDCATLPTWGSNDEDMHVVYDATVSDFQSPVRNEDILSGSPPIHLISEVRY